MGLARRPDLPLVRHHRDVTAALSDYASRSWAALREAGSNPSIRLIVLASIVFTVSKWALRIAKYVYLYEVAGPFGIATLGLIQIIPSILGVPFASELGDRFARDRVLAVTYSLCAVVSAALAYVLSAGSDIIFFYLLAAAVEVLGQIVRPIQAALLPGLARTPSELVAGNVALSTSEAFGALAGPALGAAILVSGGPALVALIAAGGCAISVLAVTRVHVGSAAAPMAQRVSSGVSRISGRPWRCPAHARPTPGLESDRDGIPDAEHGPRHADGSAGRARHVNARHWAHPESARSTPPWAPAASSPPSLPWA